MIAAVAQAAGARSYLEIGTAHGASLAAISCDCVCVDPQFRIDRDVIGAKRNAFFFQMTSDEFFARHDLASFLPQGVDLAFLDGMHQFEFLLRDFINTERHCRPGSIVLLHDCLPLNERMAERLPRNDPAEAMATRDYWTGDVWRLLPILARYRPDLRILALDCPPTGLVACTRLDPGSTALDDAYQAIVDEFGALELSSFGLERLWRLYPVRSSRALLSAEALASMLAPS